MKLAHGISFEQLYTRDGLVALDASFIAHLSASNAGVHNRLVTARANPDALNDKEHSQLIIDAAPHVEDFIAELFGIRSELTALKEKHFTLAPLYSCKRLFVQRRALKKSWRIEELENCRKTHDSFVLQFFNSSILQFELSFAHAVMGWLDKEEEHKESLELAAQYAAWACLTEAGKAQHASGILFKTPRKLDPYHLVPVATEIQDGITVLKSHHHRHREGFNLTDDGGSLEKALDETNYCIWCHNQGKDSCSKGLKEKLPTASDQLSEAESRKLKADTYKKSPLDIPLAGCPLEEKISEMNFLKSEGVPLGALAVITIDNPMCAGTGHRICNDCMKSCIYQKQDPVNIPQAETRTLKDILELPYGFEIYSLLTRWNPLNLGRPIPKAPTGKKVLIAGLGPAGYTLAHHLMNDGHTVVGIDGLKIEPVDANVSGVDVHGNRTAFTPIKDISLLRESLDERVLAGFGGVAEYGITVRWDKNYLKVIRLLLERREQFSMIGGVRFGSTLTIESAWELGFDHIALCMGAGKPTVLDIPNGLARGVRAASDFLMALQLTGAAKQDSIANLQLRLPVVVIGGGLTAIDTATESLAYYPRQVEKFLTRYEQLCKTYGESSVRKRYSEEEAIIADEFITHARTIRAEREKAAREHREPDLLALMNAWGGVKIAYRKQLVDAPSYRLNHEEVELAFQEGIGFCENLEPTAIEVDRFGHASAVKFKQTKDGTTLTSPARTVLVAAGTSPNTVLQREFPNALTLHGKYFQAVDESGQKVVPEKSAKPSAPHVLLAKEKDGRAISFFGDLHPSFAGNVVKAMGSAKQGYPTVSQVLAARDSSTSEDNTAFLSRLNSLLRPTVHAVNRLTPNIVEVVVHAPLAARRFEPGQFYRLQNYEANALRVNGTTLAMEGLAMTGAWVDKEKGLIATIVLEMGGSSDLCAHLRVGEPVILMGPTGTPTEIHKNSTVMLVGGGLGNAVLFSIGKALRENNSKVLYFAGYKKLQDRYKIEEIEAAADIVVWACDEGLLSKHRPQDLSYHGNIIDAMKWYATLRPPLEGGQTSNASREGYQKLAEHQYTQSALQQAKTLRAASTEAEKKLWDHVRDRKLGVKFRRQQPIGQYIADFYCSEARLIVEVDGGQHNEPEKQTEDLERTVMMERAGYHVLRFWNNEVLSNIDGVVTRIIEAINTPPASTFVDAALPQGEGISTVTCDHIIAIGSDRMMAAVAAARHGILKPHLKPGHTAIGSINSPMQCMMKEICAQCLQQHVDPESGAITYVYSCFNQDQALDQVSWPFLNQRLIQNGVHEKLTALWIDDCLTQLELRQKAA